MDHDRTILSQSLGSSNITPLISAATRGHIEVVRLLLDQETNLIELSKANGKNALHFAARQGHVEIVKSLLEKDPQLARRTDKKGQTALHMAVKGTNSEVVKALVEADPAIVMLPDRAGNTALHVATRKKRAEVHQRSFFVWNIYFMFFCWFRPSPSKMQLGRYGVWVIFSKLYILLLIICASLSLRIGIQFLIEYNTCTT